MTANHRPLEDGDIELIDRVRATPCLYDTKDNNFRLVYKKEQEWQSIAEGLDMTHWEARKRWTVLRDRYARELKQLILHPDGGEYGKNDFFRRMDFLRNFVKKREAKRKRSLTPSEENHSEKKLKPLKLYRDTCDDYSNFDLDGNETSQQNKSYFIEEIQDMSSSKFSYEGQMYEESNRRSNDHEDLNDIEEKDVEQEYQEYVEDTSANYEAVEEHEIVDEAAEISMVTPSISKRNTPAKRECTNLGNAFSMAAEETDNMSTVSQNPTNSVCTQSATSDLPLDIEETFSKTLAFYLRQLSPRYKIKAKVEMMQIIEKYIDLAESKS